MTNKEKSVNKLVETAEEKTGKKFNPSDKVKKIASEIEQYGLGENNVITQIILSYMFWLKADIKEPISSYIFSEFSYDFNFKLYLNGYSQWEVEGQYIVLQVVKNILDKKANNEFIDSPHEELKQYCKSFDIWDTSSRVIECASKVLKEWYTKNKISKKSSKDYKLVVAVDFDDTIAYKTEDFEPVKLLPNAKEVINWMYENDCYIIIWTCRSNVKLLQATKFLKSNEINFHTVNANVEDLDFDTSRKIFADVYIDDRGIFEDKVDWIKIKEIIQQKLCETEKVQPEIIIEEIILTSRRKNATIGSL
jgi:hypothetical protein